MFVIRGVDLFEYFNYFEKIFENDIDLIIDDGGDLMYFFYIK